MLKQVVSAALLGVFVFAAAATAQTTNPIVLENQQPGTNAWQIGQIGSDAVGQIKGYASATSVNKGDPITFRVSANPAQSYSIDVYRIGWYQGLGARLMQHVGPLDAVTQPACPVDDTTGLRECQWSDSYTLTTQTDWTSGVYLAVLTNARSFQNYIIFVVRDDGRQAAVLYQQPVTTYQAYNDWPNDGATGKSLYDFNSYGFTTINGLRSAVKVSFDRPYLDSGINADFTSHEVMLIHFLEKNGYDVTYSTDVDTHLDGAHLLNRRVVISAGHDEYWTKQMYDNFTAARDAGVNLAFMA